MSLFAGTSFLAGANDKPVEEAVTPPAPQITTTETEKDVETPAVKPSTATGTGTGTGTGQAAWSAALRFAPAAASRRKPAAVKPVVGSLVAARVATTSTTFSAAPAVVVPAPPTTTTTTEPIDVDQPTGTDASGKKIFRPPAMTLDQNEAFSHAMGGRKRPAGGQGGPNKKKKWKKNKKQFEIPQHVFIPDEPYNPAKPNDLQEYREYRKSRREERERVQREQRERRGSEKSWYSEDEEDEYSEEEAPRRDAPRAFAPPSSLYAPPPESTPQEPHSAAPSTAALGPPVPIRRTETADEVYARRLAMSTGAAVQGSSFTAPPPPPPIVRPAPAFVKPTSVPPAGIAPPQPQPPIIDLTSSEPAPAPAQTDAAFQKALEARRLAAEAIAKRLAADFPRPSVPGIGAYEGVVESQEVVDTSGMEGVDVVDLLARQVERDAGGEPQGTFAERMMRKMGHVQGQGLGRTGDGIVYALAAEHVDAGKKTKPGAAAKAGWVHAPSAKGRLVNMNEQTRQKEERARYGEPSRIVCLVNVLSSVDEADQETMEDLGEKLKEHGIVERLVPHSVYPPPEDPAEAVRIFAVFSGPAGAWKALKDLDARYFGGRRIAARFFDEKRFERGDWDGPVLVSSSK